MESFAYYVFCIIAAAVVFFVIKKIGSCLLKSAILLIAIGVLVAVYYLFFRQ